MKKLISTLLVIFLFQACQKYKDQKTTGHIGFDATDSVAMFGVGMVSTQYPVRDFTLSPAADELYFSVQHPQSGFSMILGSRKTGEEWTIPEVASFSGNYADFEAAFSPDGQRLYFSSNRPIDGTGKSKDFDIWYVEKEGEGWSKARNIGAPVNTEKHEFYPSVASNGNIYFTATRENGIGREDIFMSRYEGSTYTEPIPLDTAVNSNLDEFNAFVSADEDFIIFSSWGRKDDMGRSDLYISFKDSLNQWMPAKHLGSEINSAHIDYCPFVSADKRFFFFTSGRFQADVFLNKAMNRSKFDSLMQSTANGSSNIYIIDFGELAKLRE